MGTKGMLAGTSAAAVAGLLFLLGPGGGLPGGGLPGATAGTARHAPMAEHVRLDSTVASLGGALSRTAAGFAVPSPGVSSGLQAVACTSASNCWAVGSYQTKTAQLNEALRWDGGGWITVATPDHGTGRDDHSSLSAVACTSASNCWAVGSYDTGAGQRNQALHWNGGGWTRIATPDPGLAGSGTRALNGVSCVSRNDCWAVGTHISDRGISRNAVLRWNGAAWSAVSAPNPGANVAGDSRELSGVTCASAGDCWAVGGYLSTTGADRNETLHWNGTRWLRVAARGNGALMSVACTSAASCWAVQGQTSRKSAIRWNGTSWSAAATPGDAELSGVACAGAASCMAVGNRTSSGALLNSVLRWDGTGWSAVTVPDPGGSGAGAQNRLAAVACTSAANCWAVGSYWDSSAVAHRNTALRWNGHAWSSQH
jgi:hypothetical protein